MSTLYLPCVDPGEQKQLGCPINYVGDNLSGQRASVYYTDPTDPLNDIHEVTLLLRDAFGHGFGGPLVGSSAVARTYYIHEFNLTEPNPQSVAFRTSGPFNSGWDPTGTAPCFDTPTAAPVVSASLAGPNVNVSWTPGSVCSPVPGAELQYKLWRGVINPPRFQVGSSIITPARYNGTSFVDTTPNGCTTYYYEVEAVWASEHFLTFDFASPPVYDKTTGFGLPVLSNVVGVNTSCGDTIDVSRIRFRASDRPGTAAPAAPGIDASGVRFRVGSGDTPGGTDGTAGAISADEVRFRIGG